MPETSNRYPPYSLICMWSSSLKDHESSPSVELRTAPESSVLLVGKASSRELICVLRHGTPHGNNCGLEVVSRLGSMGLEAQEGGGSSGSKGVGVGGEGGGGPGSSLTPKSHLCTQVKSRVLSLGQSASGNFAVGRKKMTVLLTLTASLHPGKNWD